MRKKIFYLLLITCITFIQYGCINDDIFNQETQKEPGTKEELFTFIYQGETYSSEFTKLEDGDIILHDENTDKLRQRLLEYPELVTVHNYDGSVEYIENQEMATKRLEENNLFKENPFTRAITKYIVKSSKLIVYNETNYRGTSRTYNNTVSVPQFFRIPEIAFYPNSFKLSGDFKTWEPGPYPTPIYTRVYAMFYAGTNYTGKSSWWAIDNDRKTQNISGGIPGLSLKVIWNLGNL